MAMAVLKLLRKLAGKVTDKAKKKKERAEKKQKSRETKEKTTAKSTGSGSAFNDPSKIKAGTTQPGTRKPRTKTQKESTTARRMADKEATAKAANVETGKKVLKGAALVGVGAVGGYAAGKSEDSDKPKTDKSKDDKPKRTNQQLDAFVRESNKRRSKNKTQPEKLKEQLKAESSGDRVKRSNPPKRATVTGKKDDIASRNISRDGKKQANVTREQLERLGLDPKKKSSLTTYLNAYDRLGRRPKSKADLAAKKNMGGMMKKKEAPSRPTGYMDGGMATKTSARGKPKGCGAATGGYGRAML
jgi:hypothetical protein